MIGTFHILVLALVPGAEVVYDGPLILSLFPTPQAEREAHLSLQSLGRVYALETHYFGGFKGCHCSEKVEVLGGPPNHVVGGAKFFPPHPLVMNRVDLSA